ncbi:hypothetical protein Pcinc_015116 [Petrolisthes cinctipes]|uniref:Uncharacterized protein n=1 Tax=Petrolisthes cinctipes TaxID=88211 RepID=A0AAE1FTQ1_PETCI|nr:hypothetical protein Pcinc_015116 [Petrolisthes cinctipes]
MAASTSSCCFCCRTWGHDKAACAAPGPRCGVCSRHHWTEGCLASRKNGEQVKACCPNCRLGHYTWNPGCPARPTAGGDPSCSRNGLQAVLLEFSEGFAELLGVSVRCDKLYALVKRACSKLAAPQLTPRPVLLREKALPDTPSLPRHREVQEAPCGVPPKWRRRRSGRKKATTTTTTSGTQTTSPVTCCVGTRAAPWGCSVGTQAAAPCSGGVATQTPSPPTQERAPPSPPAAGGESSPPSSNQATQPDRETPKDLDLDEAFLVQPKKKKKKGSLTATTMQMLDAHFAARGLKIKRRKQ